MRAICCAIGMMAVGLGAAGASASILTVTGTQGNLAAQASFEAQGTNLVVTFTNVSSADVLVPADLLTCFFWDVTGPALNLTPVSAVLGGGSTVFFDPDGQPAGGIVGGEWDYVDNASGAPGGGDYGIGSSGLGIFGPASFPGPNLDGPSSVGGMGYALTSAGDNLANGNPAVTGNFPIVKNSVVFTLSGLPQGFDPSASIGNVWFQYGTSLSEPSFPGVPAPGTAAAVLAFGALAARRRRG